MVEHAEGEWAALQQQRDKMWTVMKDTEQRLAVTTQAAEEQRQRNVLAKERHDQLMVAGSAAEQKVEQLT